MKKWLLMKLTSKKKKKYEVYIVEDFDWEIRLGSLEQTKNIIIIEIGTSHLKISITFKRTSLVIKINCKRV